MTVRDLMRLLRAMPEDCHDSPVMIRVRDMGAALYVIEVNPPGAKDGLPPCVVLTDSPDAPGIPAVTMVEYPRRVPDDGSGLRVPPFE